MQDGGGGPSSRTVVGATEHRSDQGKSLSTHGLSGKAAAARMPREGGTDSHAPSGAACGPRPTDASWIRRVVDQAAGGEGVMTSSASHSPGVSTKAAPG